MKKLIERYFMSRIDLALDDAKPLRGWTAWYVRRNPALRDYYESMLEMELELRFSNENAPPVTACRSTIGEKPRSFNRAFVWTSASVVLLALATTPFFYASKSSSTASNGPGAERIDLAEIASIARPLMDILPAPEMPWLDSIAGKSSSGPVDPIVRFSETPLESTLTFFETIRVIQRRDTP